MTLNTPLALELLRLLESVPQLSATLTINQLNQFLRLCRRLWEEIHIGIPQQDQPASYLPLQVARLSSGVIGLSLPLVDICWATFRNLAPQLGVDSERDDDDGFRVHSSHHQISEAKFYYCLPSPLSYVFFPNRCISSPSSN